MSSTNARRSGRAVSVIVVAAVAGLSGVACTGGSTDSSRCTDVELVVARGTSEPGTLGVIVGDPLLTAVRRTLAPATVAGHSVAYPASTSADSPRTGNRALVAHVVSRAAACPSTRFVLVGYSQGAAVVHMSIGSYGSGSTPGSVTLLPDSVAPRIAALVFFGSPMRTTPAAWTGRSLDICATGDPVCHGGTGDFAAHLTYSANANQAASFIASKVR